MTKRQGKCGTIDVKALLTGDEAFLWALGRTAPHEVLEAELAAALTEMSVLGVSTRKVDVVLPCGRGYSGAFVSLCVNDSVDLTTDDASKEAPFFADDSHCFVAIMPTLKLLLWRCMLPPLGGY